MAGKRIFLTSVLFPLPETPVITVNTSSGKVTSIFCKLFSRAPFMSIKFLKSLRFLGTVISKSPFRYFAVSEVDFSISS